MHWQGWLALAVVVCVASGCEGQKILCSSDSDCPLGQCNTSLGRCVLKSCSTDLDCNAGTFCNATVGKICTLIPDGGEDMSCASPCPIYQVCRATECHARYQGIVITQPVAGQFVDAGSATVVARLDVNPGNARADPSFLTLTLGLPDGGTAGSGGLPMQSAGLYSGPLNPAFDGTYILSASYTDAGLTSPQVAVTLDRIPPAFVVVVPSHGRTGIYVDPMQSTAWRRDDMVTLGIQSPEPNMINNSVQLAVTGLGGSGPTLNVTPGGSCGQNYCGTVTLDMKDPTMRAFRGTYLLLVSGRDLAGNSGTSDAGIGVTRWNWQFTPGGGLPSKTTPAIGSAGTIYFATTNSSDTGTIYALNPDAGVKWSVPAGSVEGSLAVGESNGGVENVYVSVNDATSTSIRALNGNTGAEIMPRCGPFTGAIRASLAVTKSTVPSDPLRESAFGIVSGNPSYQLAALRPGGTVFCADAGVTGNVTFPGAISIDNLNNVYFGDNSANAVSLNFDGGWQPRPPNWPVPTGLNINAPVISGTNVVAGAVGTAPARGQILSIPTSGAGGVNWRFPPGTPATYNFFNPAVLAGGISNGGIAVYGDDFPNLTEIAITAPSSSAFVHPSASIVGTPAIGQGNVIYTVDTGGTVAAWSSDLSSTLWSVSPAGGSVVGPALDCSRNLSGPIPGRPGVLYVVTNSGSLFSFVVDSRGIDTSAPWPKYQHDPRNTGNQQTPLAPFACP